MIIPSLFYGDKFSFIQGFRKQLSGEIHPHWLQIGLGDTVASLTMHYDTRKKKRNLPYFCVLKVILHTVVYRLALIVKHNSAMHVCYVINQHS